MSEIYLEISSRQSGKSTRMLDAIENHVASGKNCAMVVCRCWTQAREFTRELDKRQIWPLHRANVRIITQDQINRIIHGGFADDYRWFYDEFDFLEDDKNFYFDEFGYYVTTPAKLRTKHDVVKYYLDKTKPNYGDGSILDVLLFLMDKAKGKYVSYNNFLQRIGSLTLEEIAMTDETFNLDEHFNREMSGQIFK